MTKQILIFPLVVFTILLLAGCKDLLAAPSPSAEATALPTATPVPISAPVVGYAERLSAGDLAGTLAFFDDDARSYLYGLPPVGIELYIGKEQISTFLEDNIDNHFIMEVEVLDVSDDTVIAKTTTWHDFTREIGVAPVEAIGIYTITDGKIANEAWHISEESLAKIKNALAELMPAEPEAETSREAPVSEIAVTIADATCSYEGPMTLQADSVAVTLDVQDLDKEKYALMFIRLDSDKDGLDLMAAIYEEDPLPWMHLLNIPNDKKPGETTEFNVTVREGPVYGVCLSSPPETAIGIIGPFDVIE